MKHREMGTNLKLTMGLDATRFGGQDVAAIPAQRNRGEPSEMTSSPVEPCNAEKANVEMNRSRDAHHDNANPTERPNVGQLILLWTCPVPISRQNYHIDFEKVSSF